MSLSDVLSSISQMSYFEDADPVIAYGEATDVFISNHGLSPKIHADLHKLAADLADKLTDVLFIDVHKATELSKKYKKKIQYFLNHFGLGGVDIHKKEMKISAWKSWLHVKAMELNAGRGTRDKVDEELIKCIEIYEKHCTSKLYGRWVTVSGHLTDVQHTYEKVKTILMALNMRVGIEEFYMLVRSNQVYQMALRAFFMSPDIKNVFTSSKKKASYFKQEIASILTEKLVEIMHNPTAKMEYVHYQQVIIERYNIKLISWTHEHFKSPSELSNALTPLEDLFNAIVEDCCKFVQLAPREADYLQKERLEKEKVEDTTSLTCAMQRKSKKVGKKISQGGQQSTFKSAKIVEDSDESISSSSSGSEDE
ncbi:hypothetical protein EW146_g5746 [Bondarzewia mesenterica]|uniref:Uncharacterized protein n=1 Tax=Bondarzewia mesenterica TaxID=1095465 RepID=A0A4S4LR57_9AGAM|nr:hypothetical protein EW146_g5746 [Bondarzewia mesenterica]